MTDFTQPDFTQTDFTSLLSPLTVTDLVRGYLKEDIPAGVDVGGFVVGGGSITANLYMKQSGVFAGKCFFEAVFGALDCTVAWSTETTGEGARSDGGSFTVLPAVEGRKYEYKGTPVLLAVVTGPCNQILRGERTALCLLSRCSGVATLSRFMVEIAKGEGWKGRIAGTRKTTPGMRLVEKFGLLVGGADTHRLDLSHMVMLKDNHIWAAGSITAAVEKARSGCGFSSKIEVEVSSLSSAREAASAGADVVMLDNMTHAEVSRDAPVLKAEHPSLLIEASGGVTHENLAGYLNSNVDIVSCGALTQGYTCLDYSLKINRRE